MGQMWAVAAFGGLALIGGPAGNDGLLPAVRHRQLREVTVVATGDVLTENAVLAAGERAAAGTALRYDFSPVIAPVEPLVKPADLAICHMELPVGAPGERPGVYGRSPFGGNLLLAPHEIAHDLAEAGFDRCSTASNHSNDLGPAGIDSTIAAFEAAGVTTIGTARNPDETQRIDVVVDGVWIAHLAYTNYSNTVRPAGWRLSFAESASRVAGDVRRARQQGAELVIVSVHISQEMLTGPTGRDRAFITELTDAAPVDLVIQHGPHVVQPMEEVNGTPVFWSLGNFLSGMGMPGATRYGLPTLDLLLADVRFTERPTGGFSAEARPVLMCTERFARTVYPARATLADPSTPADLRRQIEECLARSEAIVPGLG